MKFSFLTYLFCRYPLEYSFQMAQNYGFDAIEIWGARPQAYAYDLNTQEIQNILSYKKKYHLDISAYTPEILSYPYNLASTNKKEREETEDYLLRSLDAAAAMVTTNMLLTIPHPGYRTSKRQALDIILEPLKRLCNRAEELGISIMLETLSPSESNLVTTADEAAELISRVGSSAMTAMMDLVPPTIANEPISCYFDWLGDKMNYVHICNSDGVTEFHSRLDEGIIPMEDIFTLLKKYGFKGWCSLELLNPYFRDPELYLANSKRLMDRYFA